MTVAVSELPNGHAEKMDKIVGKGAENQKKAGISDLEGVNGLRAEVEKAAQAGEEGHEGVDRSVDGEALNGKQELSNGHGHFQAGDNLELPSKPMYDSSNMSSLSSSLSITPTPELELHRYCAAGEVEEVRRILSSSLEHLESLDVATGCTPIVLAIRHNHHDTVRELLTAGAIVPPPGLTSDPLMISTLYPSPHASMFGSMPYGQPMPPPEYFYFQQMDNGRMYNRHGMNGPMQGMQGMPNGGRSDQKRNGGANGNGPMSPDSTSNGGSANLPPADVAKTIPCRNFPNCKYGSSCVFFHPPGRPDQGMYGAHTMNGYHPNGGPGFDGQDGYARGMQFGFQGGFPQQGFQPQHRMSLSTSQLPDLHEQNDTGIPLVPGGEIRFDSLHISENGPNNGGRDIQHLIPDANSTDNSSSMTSSQVLEPPSESAASAANDTQTSSMVNSTGGVNIPTPNMPPPGAPPFVPGLHVPPHEMTSPPPPHAQFGASPLSPISPSMLSASLPSIPPAEAFFASTSPTNPGFSPIATGYPQPPFTHSSIMPNGLSQVMPQGIPGMQPNAQMPGVGSIVGGPHTRRQSFGQPFGISVAQLPMGPGPKFGQHKKPSFSSGPRPFRSSMGGGNGSGGVNLGSWKDGNPPPCAFFAQGKCRNGEFCKFPHLDEQGNDCRHPDVVRGIIPPLPSLGRQSRSVRHSQSGFPMPYESNFRNGQHQHLSHQHVHQQSQHISYSMMQAQHQFQANHHTQHISQQPYPQQMNNDGSLYGQNTSPDPNISSGGNLDPSASAFSTPDPSSLQNSTHLTPPPNAYPAAQPGSTKSLLGSSTVPASPMLPAITRSASQPGLQRVHATGFVSRSQSPAPSNVSFHGNGHPRRGISRGGISNVQNRGSGNRSASGDRVQVPQLPQRVPGADEFPALGGSPALNGSSGKESPTPAGQGKTAAQVLSAPAPFRPAKVDDKADDENSTDEFDPDSDAVIVSRTSTHSTGTTRAAAHDEADDESAAKAATAPSTSKDPSPSKKSSVSFADITSSQTSVESPPVGVQA